MSSPTHRLRLAWFFAAALVLALALPAAWTAPDLRWPQSWGYTLVQVACTLIALVVFVVGVRAYALSGSLRLLLLGLAFLTFGVLDLLHSIAAPGEPYVPPVAGADLSLWFWRLSRVIGSALLLASVAVPSAPTWRPGDHRRNAARYVALATFALAALTLGVTIVLGGAPSESEVTRGEPTIYRALELLAVMLQVVVVVAYLRLWRRRGQDVQLVFALGVLGLALAGTAFLAHREFYDAIFWFGYAYKVFAYLCFAFGVWLLVRPMFASPSLPTEQTARHREAA